MLPIYKTNYHNLLLLTPRLNYRIIIIIYNKLMVYPFTVHPLIRIKV